MSRRTHVWMLNMGGPNKTDAIQPFLQRLLGDPLVVPMPFRWLQAIFAWVVSRVRAPRVLPMYEMMGGASPQLKMVEDQARLLGRVLGERYHCRPVLRYSPPGADEAASALADDDQLVLLSLYPQACSATTTSSLVDARRAVGPRKVLVAEVQSYPAHDGYVEAVAETVREAVSRLPQNTPYEVLFSAHGVPQTLVERGDPYKREVESTVAAVVKAARLARPHHLSWQSRLGPAKWLQPSTRDKVRELGGKGARTLIVVPVAFTSEHLETLVELDHELKKVAAEAGITRFERAATVGTRPTFVHALADLVRQAERDAGWPVPEDEIREAARDTIAREMAREQAAHAAAEKSAAARRAAESGPVVDDAEDPSEAATELLEEFSPDDLELEPGGIYDEAPTVLVMSHDEQTANRRPTQLGGRPKPPKTEE